MHHAEDFRAGGRHHDALRLLDRVVARRPADWLTYALRADVLAGRRARACCRSRSAAPFAIERAPDAAFLLRLAAERCDKGRWLSAALLFDQVIDQGPSPHDVWTESAIAHLMIDDEPGFRRVCASMRSRHPAAIPELFLRPQLASVCALAPGGLGDDGKARGWIESLIAELRPDHKLRHAYLQISGSILYRSGRYREAIDRINEGIAAASGAPLLEDSLGPVFLAMAHYMAGDHKTARELLARQPAAKPSAAVEGQDGRYLLQRA